ncbi:putative galactinol--sucrose galactosyltransferase 2 [Glycine max]|nr:putative galactinol--sucrose galactosyltransferase 2 [Glycine max]
MTITAAPTVKDRCLEVRGKVILTHVTGNIVVSPVVGTESAFLGATSTVSSSRHVFDLGILQGYKLLSLFRVKIWWMIPPVGRSASDVPMETQLLLLKKEKSLRLRMKPTTENTCYILLLPVLDGQFRTTLQGTQSNELQLCIERDAYVQASQSLEAAFVNSGDNPFELIRDSIKILEKHKGTFCHLENKRIPAHLDWFGWSTWDAFYTEVSPQGIKEGLQSFSNEGCSPKFIIIDDGWQETLNTFRKEGEPVIEGTQFVTRLIDIKENKKFTNAGSENSVNNLHHFVDSIKQNMNSKHETAESHAAARSIGGCAVYVSDKPGNHDFKILKKLVLPDGSVLRARYAGHPTRDCLFEDPVMDGKSLLKICNLNVLTGVVGVFNCQGAGSWSLKSLEAAPSCITISGKVRPLDVEFLEEAAGENWNGDCIVYAFNAGLLSKVSCRGKLEVSLETLHCEIYTVSPIRVFGHDVQFAPIGLLDMYNSGGAIEALDCTMDVAQCVVKIKGRGCGRFGAYSNVRPKSCVVDMKEEEFSYIPENGLLTITLGCEGNSRDMEFVY